MSSPTGTYNDLGAGIPWDSFTAAIGSGGTYIFEDFTPNEGSSTQVSNNEVGVPRAARHTKTLITATATVLFPAATTSLSTAPLLFATFPTTYRGTAKTWIITKVGIPQRAGMETKLSIECAEQLNAGDS